MNQVRYRVLLAILSLAAATTVLVSTNRYGAGLSPDSVNYVAAARSFAAGKGLVMYDGSPFVVFAPLYPALLGSISHVAGLDPLSYTHTVNAVLFAAIVFLSGVLLSEYVAYSPALAFLGGVSGSSWTTADPCLDHGLDRTSLHPVRSRFPHLRALVRQVSEHGIAGGHDLCRSRYAPCALCGRRRHSRRSAGDTATGRETGEDENPPPPGIPGHVVSSLGGVGRKELPADRNAHGTPT